MRVLGIDPSLTATGVSCSVCGESVVRVKATGVVRLIRLRDEVSAHFPHTDLAAVEGYSYNSHGRVYEIGEWGGVLRVALAEAGVPWIEVPPAVLKRFATGRGNANKDAVLAAAIRRWGYEGEDNDEADAFLLRRFAEEAVEEAAGADWGSLGVRVGYTVNKGSGSSDLLPTTITGASG